MSDIEIGSVWKNKCDGVEAIVKSVGNDCVGFTQAINGKKYFYNHAVEEFKEYYEPLVQTDMVNNPPHYKDASGIECIEVTSKMQFCGGNCFKYLYRAGKKGATVEDLKKAAWYADKAKFDNEKVCWSAIIGISTVASVKNKNIGAAMNYISTEDWQWVIVSIKAEIARLESEAVND